MSINQFYYLSIKNKKNSKPISNKTNNIPKI